MTLTQFGYCPRCDEERVELTPYDGGVLGCHKCGNLGVFDSKDEHERVRR